MDSLRKYPERLGGIAFTVLAHGLLVGFVLTSTPVRETLKSRAPLMVEILKPEALSQPPRAKLEPKVDKLSKPLAMKKLQPRSETESPVIAAPSAATTAIDTPAPAAPKPAPPIDAPPASTAPPPPVAPAPLVPPDFKADYLLNPAPAYPSLSRRLGEEGRVVLRVYVETSGLPSTVEVRTSSGSERLDQAAMEAVRRWKFVAAKQGERAVPAHVLVPILFNLKS